MIKIRISDRLATSIIMCLLVFIWLGMDVLTSTSRLLTFVFSSIVAAFIARLLFIIDSSGNVLTMQQYTPSYRVILAFVLLPTPLAVAMFMTSQEADSLYCSNIALSWLFFASIYIILRCRVTMSSGVCLAMGVAAALMASLVTTSYSEAINIHFSTSSSGIERALSELAWRALISMAFLMWPVYQFYLIIKGPETGGRYLPNLPATVSENLRAVAQSRALFAFGGLVLCSVTGLYWLALHNYRIAEAADDGIVQLFERKGTPSANPIVIQIPGPFRYQSRDGRSGKWKDYKRNEISLTAFYPGFSSPRDTTSEARELKSGCSSLCNAQLIINITNIKSYLTNIDTSNYAGIRAANPKGDQMPFTEFGFNKVFDDRFGKFLMERTLLKASEGRVGYSLAAQCSMLPTSPSCRLFFSLECSPSIGVEVGGWPYERMDEAVELQRRVNEFVSSMVKEPKCQAATARPQPHATYY